MTAPGAPTARDRDLDEATEALFGEMVGAFEIWPSERSARDRIRAALDAYAAAQVAEEREACAKVADRVDHPAIDPPMRHAAQRIASAIRARGTVA